MGSDDAPEPRAGPSRADEAIGSAMRRRQAVRRVLVWCGILATLAWQPAGAATNCSAAVPYWQRLESELVERGHATDTGALIRLARAPHDGANLMDPTDDRADAIKVLGLRGEQASTSALWSLACDDDSAYIRRLAATALARLGDDRGVVLLRAELAAAQNIYDRLFLARALAGLGDTTGYRDVLDAATSPASTYRIFSAGVLVQFQGRIIEGEPAVPEPAEVLLSLAEDPEPDVRWVVAAQLPRLVDRGVARDRVAPALELLAEDPDPGIGKVAKWMLAAVLNQDGRSAAEHAER